MKNETIWIIDSDSDRSSKPVIDYIIDQGKDLERQTNGRVKGELALAGTSFIDSINLIQAIAKPVYSPTQHKDMKDASALYTKVTYEFFIVDKCHNYELSVFKITCNDIMPVSLSIDPTIAKESRIDQTMEINSLETFQKCFGDIVSTQKVRYIIRKLLELSNERDGKGSVDANDDVSEENQNE